MSVEQLQTLSLVSYIIAGVLVLTAIALFFLLDIKKVIGDVTGATARKAINTIREQNEASGDKAYKPSPVNAARGKLTDKISPSGRLQPQTAGIGGSPGTEKFDTTQLMPPVEETTVLDNTTNETTVLNEKLGETTVLEQNVGSGETTVLSGNEDATSNKVASTDSEHKTDFSTDVEMGFTDSSEIIE